MNFEKNLKHFNVTVTLGKGKSFEIIRTDKNSLKVKSAEQNDENKYNNSDEKEKEKEKEEDKKEEREEKKEKEEEEGDISLNKNYSFKKGLQIYLDHYKKNISKFEENNIYNVYDMKQVKEKMEETIYETMNLINIQYDYAFLFLKAYKFNANDMLEEWFQDTNLVFRKAEMTHLREEDVNEINSADTIEKKSNIIYDENKNTISPDKEIFTCPVLLNEYNIKDSYALKCGHRFSTECWNNYLITSLDEDFDEKIIRKKCIDLECKEIVKKKDWKHICNEKNFERYNQILLNIYIKKNPSLKKCPNKKCNYIIESIMLKDNNIICKNCGNFFCFSCSYEIHRPVKCSVIEKWNDLLKRGKQNVQWININTKKCPNCKKPIEKDSGCMNIKCRCGFSFCWLCLKQWDIHKGGFYKCNQYVQIRNEEQIEQEEIGEELEIENYKRESQSTENDYESAQMEKKKTKQALHKYHHYKTRFDAHEQGEIFSIQTLYFLKQFYENNDLEKNKLADLENAIIQIIKCRKILKWTYAYAYFSEWENEEKKASFEYHQGALESKLETLQSKTQHLYLNKTLKNTEGNIKITLEIKKLTSIIETFFDNMCQFIEKDFIE